MSTFTTNLVVGFDDEGGFLTFTQTLTGEGHPEFPSWPWPDMVRALGFFDDVVVAVNEEVKQFLNTFQNPMTVTMKFNRHEPLPPSADHRRCANAWVRFDVDAESKTLTMELHRVPGTYKDFVLLDALDHLEGRAGRGKNQYVDGRPSVLRQKLQRALARGPVGLYDPDFRPEPIPAEERVWTSEED